MADLDAVIWDFGGVLTSSPFEAFNRYEAERGLPKDLIRSLNATNPDTNAWAKLERSDIGVDEFDALFAAEAKAAGFDVRGADVLTLLPGDLRPRVVAALQACAAAFKTGYITNNAPTGSGAGMADSDAKASAVQKVFEIFDHVIESSKIGLRKPDPKIYALMCETLSVDPTRCVYLDDLGINCKPARAMGMTTIKVVDQDQALRELAEATGLTFA